MKRISILVVILAAALGTAIVLGGWVSADTPQRDAAAPQLSVDTPAVAATATPADLQSSAAGDKKCSFDSDCPYGKCKSGKCGGCGFDSDCKGWGKCKGGWCGSCGFDSDCKGFGGCKSGKCEKSPY